MLVDRAGGQTVLSRGWSDWPNLSWSEATTPRACWRRTSNRPVVSPDGRAVVATVGGRWLFVRRTPTYHPNATRVWIDRIEVATGQRLPWRELRPADPAGARMIGRALVTPDGRSYVYSVGSSLRELFLAEGLR